MQKLYNTYCTIGGYPAVVLKYPDSRSAEDCSTEILKIIHLFVNESKRYFLDILDDAVYDNMFASIARILAKEKKDLPENFQTAACWTLKQNKKS